MDYSAWVQTTNIFVVIGVSLDHAKYGYRVWKHLRLKGLTALPVNPKYDHIEGERAYANLETMVRQNPGIVDKIVVIIVVPPAVTQTVLKAAHSLGIKRVWMQPGSEDAVR